jgi:formylglycine-generating enzyme required for sulfatase activity
LFVLLGALSLLACRGPEAAPAETPREAVERLLEALAVGDCEALYVLLPPSGVPPRPSFERGCRHDFEIDARAAAKKRALRACRWHLEVLPDGDERARVLHRLQGMTPPWGGHFDLVLERGGWRVMGLFDDSREETSIVRPRAVGPAAATAAAVEVDMRSLSAGRARLDAPGSREGDAAPVDVEVAPFSVDRREVRAREFARCVRAGACDEATFTAARARSECGYGDAAREERPMNCVSWWGAAQYCRWRGARLPTEAELEIAARGAGDRRHPWGGAALDCGRAVIGGCGASGPRPPCSAPAGNSPEGLCDLVGNVDEWTAMASDVGIESVLFGGAYDDIPSPDEAAGRQSLGVAYQLPFVGFRCAR